ncbi:hypothetical protein MGALJ_35220 [Mycobacterium gallinarum]|uniref:Uncharacterized protein n=2 Tax=Mycobacterium gallinarum TaxID=39689 RepID=A0A9W4B4G2_9MYCO|nr:hypothetical protein MGALJ_35220 [Mycobacterium gallinarum]
MKGPWGPVRPVGSGRTALLMTLAGRMRPMSGVLTVLGRHRTGEIFAHLGIDELDTVAEFVTVRDLISEQLRWDAP